AFLFSPDEIADGLHQVRLAEADAAIHKEWIVCPRRCLRHSQTRRMRDLVVWTDDKCLKRISWVETERATAAFRLLRRFRALRDDHVLSHFAGVARKNEFYFERRTERGHDRRLQRGHVITFNPKLINVVWNTNCQSHVRGLDQFH